MSPHRYVHVLVFRFHTKKVNLKDKYVINNEWNFTNSHFYIQSYSKSYSYVCNTLALLVDSFWFTFVLFFPCVESRFISKQYVFYCHGQYHCRKKRKTSVHMLHSYLLILAKLIFLEHCNALFVFLPVHVCNLVTFKVYFYSLWGNFIIVRHKIFLSEDGSSLIKLRFCQTNKKPEV